jgi:hypothetical protein
MSLMLTVASRTVTIIVGKFSRPETWDVHCLTMTVRRPDYAATREFMTIRATVILRVTDDLAAEGAVDHERCG